MATLADTIKSQNKLSGVSAEEARQRLGMAAQPITPGGAAAIGASPDSAKMAGTPAQKTAALRQSTEPSMSLADTLRRQQVRGQATEEEQEKIGEAERISGLERLGTAVTGSAQEALRKTTGGVDQQVELADLEGINNAEQAASLFNEYYSATGPRKNEIRAQLINNFNLTNQQIDSFLTGGTERGQVEVGDIAVNQLDWKSLGFEGPEEINELVGQDISGMSVQQLQEAITNALNEEFSRVEELQAIVNSDSVSAADKAEARKELRALGAVGVRDVEQDVEELEETVNLADQIDLGEELGVVSVEELLSDEYVTELIRRTEDPQDEFSVNDLREINSGLANFYLNNQRQLENASRQLRQQGQQFQQIQERNKQKTQGLSSDVLRDLGLSGAQASDINLREMPEWMQTFSYLSPAAKAQVGSLVSGLKTADPKKYKALENLSRSQMGELAQLRPELQKEYLDKEELVRNRGGVDTERFAKTNIDKMRNNQLLSEAESARTVGDLDRSIEAAQEYVRNMPRNHPGRVALLNRVRDLQSTKNALVQREAEIANQNASKIVQNELKGNQVFKDIADIDKAINDIYAGKGLPAGTNIVRGKMPEARLGQAAIMTPEQLAEYEKIDLKATRESINRQFIQPLKAQGKALVEKLKTTTDSRIRRALESQLKKLSRSIKRFDNAVYSWSRNQSNANSGVKLGNKPSSKTITLTSPEGSSDMFIAR